MLAEPLVSCFLFLSLLLLILGFMMVPLAADLHLTSTQTGGLVTWTLLGGAIGGSVFGILADYFGRARILSISASSLTDNSPSAR
mgnify:CR=1 FL=1